MLSLLDDWDYSINGLIAISKKNEKNIVIFTWCATNICCAFLVKNNKLFQYKKE